MPKTNLNQSAKLAYTLVELMLVIGLLGILAAVTANLLNSRGIRSKARDSQRVADLKRVQTALELYFSDKRSYPRNINWTPLATVASSELAGYMDQVPVDPLTGTSIATTCFSVGDYGYYYKSNDVSCGSNCTYATKYILGAKMENTTSASASGCSTLPNCNSGIGCADCRNTLCYGVQNPL